MSVSHKLKSAAIKGALIAGIGAVGSIVLHDGGSSVKVMGGYMPKFVVVGGSLFASSIIADTVVPYVTPFASVGSPAVRQFENLLLVPALVGLSVVLLDSIVAPDAVKSEGGNLFKSVSIGFGSTIGAAYVAEGLGWIDTVTA